MTIVRFVWCMIYNKVCMPLLSCESCISLSEAWHSILGLAADDACSHVQPQLISPKLERMQGRLLSKLLFCVMYPSTLSREGLLALPLMSQWA